ncbi:VP1 [Rabbit bocavirus]|nr:VP1 [Rabbit bocavirus]
MAPLRPPKGWTLNGYNYLGPFNPLNNGTPVNKADAAAQKHDQAYNDYLKSGKNPYLYFNKADQTFLDDLRGDWSAGGLVGKGFFGLKKAIAPTLNEPELAGDKKERAAKRKLYFARSNKPSKSAKMSAPEAEGAGDGISTGGWEGGEYFSDHTVITTVTRQWYVPIYNGHQYRKLLQPSPSQDANYPIPWQGISTPWGYFNLNCYNSHFTPLGWQRLLNEYSLRKRWRPRKMRVKLYNLQIKQVVQLGADTLYNNDLTAGVHIFCDGSHQFPYTQHPWDEQTLPELPNDIYKLPQYAYFQVQGDLTNNLDNNAVERLLQSSMPVFILETATHQVLRTGESTGFEFNFDCGWVYNDHNYAPPQADFNPLVPTRRRFPVYQGNNSWSTTKYGPYKKPSNWMPGPGNPWRGRTNSATEDNKNKGPVVVTYAPLGAYPQGGQQQDQGQGNEQVITVDDIANLGWQVNPTNGACMRNEHYTLQYGPNNPEEGNNANYVHSQNLDIDMTRYSRATRFYNDNTNQNRVLGDDIVPVWMYPNQAWNSCPISRDNPIWDKVPRTEHQTIKDSSDGTLPLEHPPGTIYVKVAKIPIPTEQNTDSYLNIYCTGQITVEIEWDVERYQTKNWRPEIRATSNAFGNRDIYDFDKKGKYQTPIDFQKAMPTKYGINRVNQYDFEQNRNHLTPIDFLTSMPTKYGVKQVN